jgi:hypothetical protein
MKYFNLFIFAMIGSFGLCSLAQNSSQLTNQEQIQQRREQDRKEDALRDSVYQPNPKSTPTQVNVSNIDPNATIEIDHKALAYGPIIEGDRVMMGYKFTSALALGLYKDQESERWRLIAGVEMPADNLTDSLIWFVGGGGQLGGQGDTTSLYFNGGLDHRILSWFKLQYGLNWVMGGSFGAMLAGGLTF